MSMIRRGAVALAALAALGTSAGFVVAAETASAAPTVVTYTSQERTAVLEAPGLVAYGFNLYQPSVFAPGYRLAATATELCLTGPRGKLCTWRITQTGRVPSELTGNAVVGPFGQAGNITGGTGSWRGAKGVFRAPNLIPGSASVTLVFSTP